MKQGVSDSLTPTKGCIRSLEGELMKQGVSDSLTPTKGCIRSPEGETRSLRLTDSYQGLHKESGG